MNLKLKRFFTEGYNWLKNWIIIHALSLSLYLSVFFPLPASLVPPTRMVVKLLLSLSSMTGPLLY